MRTWTKEACETIDAAVFSGDEFLMDVEARKELRGYMARWERNLKEADDVAAEVELEAKDISEKILRKHGISD